MSAFRKTRWPAAALSGTVAAALMSAVLPSVLPARAADRSGPPVPARCTHQRLHWQPCTAKPSLECASTTVPRDWHHPGTGSGLTVEVSRHRAADPATYHEGARAAHRALRGSRLVTVSGGGDHGQYQNGNACVDGMVNAYLLDAKAPEHDTSCAAAPLPEPSGGGCGKRMRTTAGNR
ncbi:alpha/beta hydrolase [Streptomyces sp. NPDC054765]